MAESFVDWAERWRHAEETELPPPEDIPGPTAGVLSEYDAFGRKLPRRLGSADYLLVIARSEPARVRRVPSQAVVEEGDDDDGAFALVECPCGTRPVVRGLSTKCTGCNRNYVRFEGGTVFVAYGDGQVPPLSVRPGS